MTKSSFNLNRRRFTQLISLTAISILAGETICPRIAYADDSKSSNLTPGQERYHIFIGDRLAQEGGKQAVTLKSGIVKTISIPKRSREETHITLKQAGLDGGDVDIILHTLFDPSIEIDGAIEQAISSVPVLKATRDRCRDVYQQVKQGNPISDPQALDILDAVVSGSSIIKSDLIRQRYQLASHNSRLVELQTYIESAVDSSDIPSERRQQLKGIYQYVRAGEALSSADTIDALSEIDAIVQGSTLPVSLRQLYAIASAQTRAFTVDEAIQTLIRTDNSTKKEAEAYLEAYHQIRLGGDVENQAILAALDTLIDRSSLPAQGKAIYKLARNQFFKQDQQDVEENLDYYLKAGRQAAKNASSLVPEMTEIFASAGVTAGTGTAIGTLTGAAATNATLAVLGGGSVAAGGLGMLGGLAVVTGGAALVGAAALVSVSVVAGMSSTELHRLGVAATAGTVASVTVMGTAWAIASTFLVAGNLSGAAAISATIAALGGMSVMTGGAAAIAFGVSLGVWHFLKDKDSALKATLKQIEPTLYIIAEAEQQNYPILSTLKKYLAPFADEIDETYVAPDLPINKVSNALSNYAALGRNEKVLAMVDTSLWDSGKAGITFTDRGIWWKAIGIQDSVEYTDPDYFFKIKDLPTYGSEQEAKQIYELAWKLHKDAVAEVAAL